MRSRLVSTLATVLWLLLPMLAAGQSSAIAEGHYRKAHALYKSKPPDYVNAAIWYRKAAELGHSAAQNDLGWLHQNGWGVPRDLVLAVYWYRQAATQGYATAQVNLGYMYQKGWGVPQNAVEAVRWYRLAAAQGEGTAADNLGVLYRDGSGVRRDYAEAVAWFRKSAAAGNSWGQTDLGWMYHNGWGGPRDYAEAMKWYRLAAAQGDALAQNNLGVMYRDSLGVPRDLDQALAWFRKGAAGGEARAQQSLRHLESRDRGMTPWSTILEGKSVRVAISAKGWVYLFADLTVRLPAGSTIDVAIPVKTFTDPELRELGVLQPNGTISIKENPNLPYKPMRAASAASSTTTRPPPSPSTGRRTSSWRRASTSNRRAPSKRFAKSSSAPTSGSPCCSTLSDMRSAVTIRLDPDLERLLDRLCKQTGRTRSELVRDALRRQLSLMRFERLRRRALPFAEARGYLTDEDVTRDVS